MKELSHLDEEGRARMVDVGGKDVVAREAVASARLRMQPETAALIEGGKLPKGDVTAVARVAGIMAAKRTPDLVPLCHPIALAGVEVDVAVDASSGTVTVTTTVRAADRTGVEMEALVAASVAALVIYDMVKGVERGVVIEQVRLEAKSGGRHGEWRRA